MDKYITPKKEVKYITRITHKQRIGWQTEYQIAFKWPPRKKKSKRECYQNRFLRNSSDPAKTTRFNDVPKEGVVALPDSRPTPLCRWDPPKSRYDQEFNVKFNKQIEFTESSRPEYVYSPPAAKFDVSPRAAICKPDLTVDDELDYKIKHRWKKTYDSEDEEEYVESGSEKEDSESEPLDPAEQRSQTKADQDSSDTTLEKQQSSLEPDLSCEPSEGSLNKPIVIALDSSWGEKEHFSIFPDYSLLDPSYSHSFTMLTIPKPEYCRPASRDSKEHSPSKRCHSAHLAPALEKVQKNLLQSVYHRSYNKDVQKVRPKTCVHVENNKNMGFQSIYMTDYQGERQSRSKPCYPIQLKHTFMNGDWNCHDTTYADAFGRRFPRPKTTNSPSGLIPVRKGTSNQNPSPQRSTSKILPPKTGWGMQVRPPNTWG